MYLIRARYSQTKSLSANPRSMRVKIMHCRYRANGEMLRTDSMTADKQLLPRSLDISKGNHDWSTTQINGLYSKIITNKHTGIAPSSIPVDKNC